MDCRKGGGKLIVSVIDSLFQSSNKSYDRLVNKLMFNSPKTFNFGGLLT